MNMKKCFLILVSIVVIASNVLAEGTDKFNKELDGFILSPLYVYVGSPSLGNAAVPVTEGQYLPRGRNELHTIFDHHFPDFCEQYDEKYASRYGMFRLERIQQIGEKFSICGDYLQGIARIRCTNPECGDDYFRPFSITQHIPPQRLQLIRRYGLYASRTKGRWDQMPHIVQRAPEGWKAAHPEAAPHADDPGFEPLPDEQEIDINSRKRAWARLLAKIYEVDPFVCPKCGSEMKMIAVIEDRHEIRRILRHLAKIGRSPPGLNASSMN